jgi:hypothetical protein
MHGHGLHATTRLRTRVARFAAVAVAAALTLAPTAAAADPGVIHFTYAGAFTDDNFCGTGAAIEISYSGHFTGWLAPNQPVGARNFSAGSDRYTNPVTGTIVTVTYAYGWTGTVVSGDIAGLHTIEWTFKGASEIVRPVGGGVLSRDVGNLVVLATFDGDELVGTDVVLDHGGHPAWMAFCDSMVPALGLP